MKIKKSELKEIVSEVINEAKGSDRKQLLFHIESAYGIAFDMGEHKLGDMLEKAARLAGA